MNSKGWFLCLAGLVLFFASGASAQERSAGDDLHVSFDDGGNQFACRELEVQLRMDGRTIDGTYPDGKFVIPTEIERLNAAERPAEEKMVDVTIHCDGHKLFFPGVPTSFLNPGHWRVGIEYPPFSGGQFRRDAEAEQGLWISYIAYDSKDGEGVMMANAHSSVPFNVLHRLVKEQPSARGVRARDIADALAVFHYNYEQNRDYLLGLLGRCVQEPSDAGVGEECNEDLLEDITNLYWRGDSELLQPLLEVPAWNMVGQDVGTFYADLLNRQPGIFVEALQKTNPERQRTVCRLAGEEFSWTVEEEKMQPIEQRLQDDGSEAAKHCLLGLKETVGSVDGDHPQG